MIRFSFIIFCLIFFCTLCIGQRNCIAPNIYSNTIQLFPNLKEKFAAINIESFKAKEYLSEVMGIITIPVIVHIVYKTEEQKISLDQINSQIEVLNEDFSGTNKDIVNVPGSFKVRLAGDCGIRFKLDSVIWKKTETSLFVFNTNPLTYRPEAESEPIKFASKGGSKVVSPLTRLNIWVGNIIQDSAGKRKSLEGYASFPPGIPEDVDGIVVNYRNFGRLNLYGPYNKGRTTTHEVGHYLNLRHIWGDAECGDDFISDTPVQQAANRNCINGVKTSCNNGPLGDMYMNYLDYVDDDCMYMFTKEQAECMRRTFAQYRPGFLLVSTPDYLPQWQTIPRFSSTIKDLKQGTDTAYISLLKSISDESVKVYLKEVTGNNWIVATTKDSILNITGLKPEVLYELKIKDPKNNSKELEDIPSIIFMPRKENFQFKNENLKLK